MQLATGLAVYHRPCPEERPLGRVSKDVVQRGALGHPSRRRQKAPPQDDGEAVAQGLFLSRTRAWNSETAALNSRDF